MTGMQTVALVSAIVGFGIGDWFHMVFKPRVKRLHRKLTKKSTSRKRS